MLKMMKMDFNTRVGSFCVDTVDEIEKLPTLNAPGQDSLNTVYCAGMGSDCLVISDGTVYILNGNNEWVELGGDGGNSNEILSFLPYPEGIYGYWDYEHGLGSTEWKDILRKRVLKTNEGVVFSIKDGYVNLSGGNTSTSSAPLNITDSVITIYWGVKGTNAYGDRNMLVHGADEESTNTGSVSAIIAGTEMRNGWWYSKPVMKIKYSSSSLSQIECPLTYQLPVKHSMATSIVPGMGYVMLEDSYQSDNISNIHITNEFGLASGANYKYILLSNGVVNVQQIQANLKALEEKYFPA